MALEDLNDNEDFLSRRILAEELLVYVLPKVKILETRLGVKRKIKHFGVLADGNNREGGNYDRGGENVIVLAENLLMENESLLKFFAFILSPENAQKRGENFFQKMTQAFLMLGIRIVTKGVLGGNGIRLSYEGNLDELRENKLAAEFVEMVLAVAKINEEYLAKFQEGEDILSEPKELVLGINYSDDVLQKRSIDLLYRSGMEEGNVARFGSTRPDENVWLSGDQKLWPQVVKEDLQKTIDQVEDAPDCRFEKGYSSGEIAEIIRSTFLRFEKNQYLAVTIPYSGPFEEAEKIFMEIVFDENNRDLPLNISFLAEGISHAYFTNDNYKFWNFLVVSDFESVVQNRVNAVVAPNQTSAVMKVPDPERLSVGYANIFASAGDTKSISENIKRALEFKKKHIALKGAERKGDIVEVVDSEEDNVRQNPEFQGYFKLQNILKSSIGESLESIAEKQLLEANDDGIDKFKKFNLVADLFVAKMLIWVDSLKINWRKDVEFRALVNYHLTSFFLTCCPDGSNEGKLIDDWEINASYVARYMTLVYLMDDRIYDLKLENSGERKYLIDVATEQFYKAVDLQEWSAVSSEISGAGVVNIISKEFKLLAEELSERSEPKYFSEWQKAMQNLFKCHQGEWEEKVVDNKLIDRLSKNYQENIDEFLSKYGSIFVSCLVKNKVENCLGKLQSDDEQSRYKAVCDLRLYSYLFDIEDSIGAGLVYRTVACFGKEKNVNSEIINLYEEICLLINIYFRLANDFAEMYRANDDKEENQDSCSIVYAKYAPYLSKSEALIYGSGEIYALIQEFKKEIVKKRSRFQKLCENVKPWDRVSLAIVRSDIAELYYRGTHYREAKRSQVESFFEQLYYLGVINN